MLKFDQFARVATAAVGALVLSTMSIAAAIGPAAHSTGTTHMAYAMARPGVQANG
jgi:hypothetical protein